MPNKCRTNAEPNTTGHKKRPGKTIRATSWLLLLFCPVLNDSQPSTTITNSCFYVQTFRFSAGYDAKSQKLIYIQFSVYLSLIPFDFPPGFKGNNLIIPDDHHNSTVTFPTFGFQEPIITSEHWSSAHRT